MASLRLYTRNAAPVGIKESIARDHPLAFAIEQAQHLGMTPSVRKPKPTAGALLAASHIELDPSQWQSLAELIDQETGVREVLDILENIIAEAGDLIERRSPELVAQARAAVRRFADGDLRQAE